MSKRFLLLIFFISFSFILFFRPSVSAQSMEQRLGVMDTPTPEKYVPPIEMYPKPSIYPPNITPGIYLVSQLDKDGLAQVAGKIVLDPSDKKMQANFNFFIPGKDINFVRAVQEKYQLKTNCDPIYDYPIQEPPRKLYPMEGSLNVGESTVSPDTISSPPAEPGNYMTPPAYKNNCYDNYVQIYTSLDTKVINEKDGVRVFIKAIPSFGKTEQDSILFLYRTKSLVSKFLTNRYFKISTPQLPISIDTAQVGIILKNDLYLKSLPPTPAYFPVFSFKYLERATDLKNEENQELMTLSSDITYQGIVRKTETDISPLSSFTVKIAYGTFVPLLFINEIAIGFIIFAVFVTVLILALRKIFSLDKQVRLIIIAVVITFLVSLVVIGFALFFYFLLRSQPIMYR